MRDPNLPERRQGYKELQAKLDAHTCEVQKKLRSFFVKALIALALIGLTSTVALAGFGVVLRKQGDQQDLIAKQANEIQKQRQVSIGDACHDTNERHIKTVQALIRLSSRAQANAKSPVQKQKLKQGYETTLILINALAPKRDCLKVVRTAVQPVTQRKENP